MRLLEVHGLIDTSGCFCFFVFRAVRIIAYGLIGLPQYLCMLLVWGWHELEMMRIEGLKEWIGMRCNAINDWLRGVYNVEIFVVMHDLIWK